MPPCSSAGNDPPFSGPEHNGLCQGHKQLFRTRRSDKYHTMPAQGPFAFGVFWCRLCVGNLEERLEGRSRVPHSKGRIGHGVEIEICLFVDRVLRGLCHGGLLPGPGDRIPAGTAAPVGPTGLLPQDPGAAPILQLRHAQVPRFQQRGRRGSGQAPPGEDRGNPQDAIHGKQRPSAPTERRRESGSAPGQSQQIVLILLTEPLQSRRVTASESSQQPPVFQHQYSPS